MIHHFRSFCKNWGQSFACFRARSVSLHSLAFAFWLVLVCIDFGYWRNTRLTNSLILAQHGSVVQILDLTVSLFLILSFFVFTASVLWQVRLYTQKNSPSKIWFITVKEYLFTKLYYLRSIFLWSLALIIPGIIAACVYIFASAASVFDDMRPKEGMDKSQQIFRRHLHCILDQFLYSLFTIFIVVYSVFASLEIFISTLVGLKLSGLALFISYLEYYVIVYAVLYLVIFYGNVYLQIREQK